MKMKSFVALALALTFTSSLALMAATDASAHTLGAMSSTKSAAPSSDIEKVDRRGRNVGLGIAAIVGTAILLNEAARADGHRRYRRNTSCGRLLYRCEDGSEWSCRRYEDRCM